MRTPARKILILFVFLALCAFGISQWFLRASSVADGFKTIAEEKVSSFLQAKVKIGDVKVGFLNQIALSNLRIGSGSSPKQNPFEFEVDSIVFRYSFFKILSKSLEAPAAILLKAPKLFFDRIDFPYEALQDLDFSKKGSGVSTLELHGGEIRYQVPGIDSEIRLTEVEGVFKPRGIRRVHADIKAVASGFLEGPLHIKGEIDPLKRSHELEIKLATVNVSKTANIPFEDITGTIRWVDGDLYFDEVESKVHGWGTKLKGVLKNLEPGKQPILNLDLEVGKHQQLFGMSLKVDLEKEDLKGALQPFSKEPFNFEGKIAREEGLFLFSHMILQNGYLGGGRLDFGTGDYEFEFNREMQRIAIESNINDLDFKFQFLLNHLDLFGLDLVTSAVIELKENRGSKGASLFFDGVFKTDYFVLQQTPFDDFRGTFMVTKRGVENIDGKWGSVFGVLGDIFFRPTGPEIKMTLRADGYSLDGLHEFAAKPLPKRIGGMLEGKLKLEGPIRKPEVQGNFSVKKGWAGRLDYDRCFLHFRGILPYLTLYDSRILRGRTSLQLKGALDFSLDRFYHGVSIQSSDKLILWKGWEVNTSQQEGDFEIETFMNLPKLTVAAGFDSRDSLGDPDGSQDDRIVTVGHKLKF